MKRIGCFAAALLGVAGCHVKFEADTTVAPDGRVTREIRYVADTADAKKELEEFYQLPGGGVWTTTQPKPAADGKLASVPTTTYALTERYRVGEAIAPDHRRRAKARDVVVPNEIRVSVRDRWFWRRFDYRERFWDLATMQAAIEAGRRLYPYYVELLANRLEQRTAGEITTGQARIAIVRDLEPRVDRVIQGLQRAGKAFLDSDAFRKDWERFNQDQGVELWLLEILPRPASSNPEAWQGALHDALGSGDWMSDPSDDLEKMGDLEPRLSGLYGFGVASTGHAFRHSVLLPGTILKTNASRRDGQRLIWEFDSGEFQWQEKVLEASSRLVFPGRIALAIAALLVAVWSAVQLRRRRV